MSGQIVGGYIVFALCLKKELLFDPLKYCGLHLKSNLSKVCEHVINEILVFCINLRVWVYSVGIPTEQQPYLLCCLLHVPVAARS